MESVSVSVVTFSVHSVILSILKLDNIPFSQYQDHVAWCCYLFSEGEGDTGGLGGKGPNLNGDEGGEVCCRNIV